MFLCYSSFVRKFLGPVFVLHLSSFVDTISLCFGVPCTQVMLFDCILFLVCLRNLYTRT